MHGAAMAYRWRHVRALSHLQPVRRGAVLANGHALVAIHRVLASASDAANPDRALDRGQDHGAHDALVGWWDCFMPLKFPGAWRFEAPADGTFVNGAMPPAAVGEFSALIERMPAPKGRWAMLEHFKYHFGASSSSSSEGWAMTDLMRAMDGAANNAPLFIESFYDACESLRSKGDGWFVPDASHINTILRKCNVGYELQPPDLIAREPGGPTIPVAVPPPSLAERAKGVIEDSLSRSDQLLSEGHPREAVQEVVWLLETVATAFNGVDTQSGKIEGKYFNQIVRDLRAKRTGTTLERVLDWITAMHGYLSSPTGGGVRHGTDLGRGVYLDIPEARLFCNLTRSYISFLLAEYESLLRAGGYFAVSREQK